MKKIQITFVMSALIALTLSFSSCNTKGDQTSSEKKETLDQTGIEYTSAYVCPMHCKSSGSDQPGKCPVCGMDYVKNDKHQADEHKHDHDNHEGHEH